MSSRFRGRLARAALMAVVGLLVATRWWLTAVSQPHNLAEGAYRVERVLSADTLELSNQKRIRLLGIVAPYRGRIKSERDDAVLPTDSIAAADFTRSFLGGGEVLVQFDRTCVDSTGQLLAYVWVVDQNGGRRLLNEELIRAGMMRFDTKTRCSAKMKRRLAQAADDAKKSGRGLWASAN